MPGLGGDPGLAAEGIKQILKALNTMGGELEGLLNSIDEPPQDDLASGEMGIACKELLHRGDSFPSGGIGTIQGSEDGINAMQQTPEMAEASSAIALDRQEEIVHVHIGVAKGFSERSQHARGWTRFGRLRRGRLGDLCCQGQARTRGRYWGLGQDGASRQGQGLDRDRVSRWGDIQWGLGQRRARRSGIVGSGLG